MDTKIGVFICSGCEIGEALDVDDLKSTAEEAGAAICETHAYLCGQEGVDLIKGKIASDELNRVAVCACSGRVMTDVFDFGPEMLVDRVSLREQVAWLLEPKDEDTQMAAQDYIRMGIAKLKNSEAPQAEPLEISKTILVVGGGVSGLTSARAAADAGYDVVLVEKEAELGGWTRKFGKSFPRQAPWTDLEDNGMDALVAVVEDHPKIAVHKSTTVSKMKGAPGLFDVHLSDGTELKIGSVVQASGWRPYDPERMRGTKWNYGSSPDVVTNVQVEEMFNNGGFKRPSTGQAPKSVAFVQCAGSRDPDHLPYCSAVCCRTSLKQASLVREQFPDTKVYILYREMRSPAQFELFYKKVQEDEGIFLTKGEVYEVSPNGDQIAVKLEDTLLGENIEVQTDMVVLAAGMVPSTKVDEGGPDNPGEAAVEMPADAEVAEGEPAADAKAESDEAAGGEAAGAEAGARILNLSYRQGTDLPTLKYGFPDSHFVCFPYETLRTAVYATGCVRAPMDTTQAARDAYGAALKAIQAVELTGQGLAVHPRARDSSVPAFFIQRCTQCKRCTEECPFGTLDEDEKGTPLENPTRCRRCGICMGACPERIISFADYSPNMVSQMIKAVEIPDEEDEKPRYLAFICENDALPALDLAALKRLKISPFVRFIPVRCLGSVNTVWIGDALSSGMDGIMEFGCKYGDDYQCHFVRGSELANTRMENVSEKLKQLALEEERVQIFPTAIDEAEQLVKNINDCAEELDEIGMNPFKGF
jgi:quinone-modifying oxidoreductase subunit QmoB